MTDSTPITNHFAMLRIEELAAAMPFCQDVSMAGRRDMDLRTPITPEQGAALAQAIQNGARA